MESEPASLDCDVLIVGAGLSGIGAACVLAKEHPERRVLLLEARDDLGGTWDLFRYPAIRSDSDMFTLGFGFSPWDGARAITNGDEILEYLRSTATRFDVLSKISFHRKVLSASWDSLSARWTVHVLHLDDGSEETLTCRWLWGATGYYRYERGYRPDFVGEERFKGTFVHPQFWPEDLDVAEKRVVVIGSGATAITLVPALAELGAQVTMLQRSASYVVSRPTVDAGAKRLRPWLPTNIANSLLRARSIVGGVITNSLSRYWPSLIRKAIIEGARRQLPEGYDVDRHFSPAYNPWDQRVCLTTDGALFKAICAGTVVVATDTIDHFEETGIVTSSGEHLAADIVVTATGLEMRVLGGIELTVDGTVIVPATAVSYKGSMLCGVPNLTLTFGYTNASWTLKADLIATWTSRLFREMDRRGVRRAVPRPPSPALPRLRYMDLSSGYVLRAAAELPKQVNRRPWAISNNYLKDWWLFRAGRLDEELDLLA